MYLKKKISESNFNIFDILVILIPFSIIIGNFLINLNLILLILFGLFKYFTNLKEFLKNNYLYFLIFVIFIAINLYFSDDLNLSVIGIIGLLKNLLVSFLLFFWLKSIKKNFEYLSISISFAIIILSISVLSQFIYYEYYNILYNRVNGLFIDESVAGSYIIKLLVPTLVFIFTREKSNTLVLFLFTLTFSAVLISGDRAPAILYFISFFIFIIFNKNLNLKNSINSIIILVSIILICLSISSNFRNKITYTSGQFGFTFAEKVFYNLQKNIFKEKKRTYEEYINTNNRKNESNFLETKWFEHYSKAFKIGKKNLLIGSGIKSFRTSCKISKYNGNLGDNKTFDYGCATHPHNIYLEIFSETGIVGILIFIPLIIYCLIITLKNKNSKVKALSLSYIFILFFPLQTTGSFFSTFNGIFYFICLSMILYLNKNYMPSK